MSRYPRPDVVDKAAPSEAWIEYLREAYPMETEVDRVLSRKLERRAGPHYSPLSLKQLRDGAEKLLTKELDEEFEIREARWLTGGASKLQIAFTLNWQPPGEERRDERMVLRMEPAESIVETSRVREFEILQTMQDVVPVPTPYWVDAEGDFLPYPGLIYSFAEGVTKPSASVSGVSGMGTNFGPELRAALAPQFVDCLARIHTHDWPDETMQHFSLPRTPFQSVQFEIGRWERVWEEDSNEEIPLMRVAANWLRANTPQIDQLSIVHGDYRAGNFLFDEKSQKITAWLDWENGHLGDRHDDIAYLISSVFGHMDESGEQFLVCGMLPLEEFYAAYEKASGLTIDLDRIAYYRILNLYKLITMVVATAPRVMRGGKTHQDVTLSWPVSAGYIFLEDLRVELEKVI